MYIFQHAHIYSRANSTEEEEMAPEENSLITKKKKTTDLLKKNIFRLLLPQLCNQKHSSRIKPL